MGADLTLKNKWGEPCDEKYEMYMNATRGRGPPPPLPFDTTLLPNRTKSGKFVAFQRALPRSPWCLFGPGGIDNEFEWDVREFLVNLVSHDEKQEILTELEEYASIHGIEVHSTNSENPDAVRMALLTKDNVWV